MPCNQSCNQGRACDCVPDIDEPGRSDSGWFPVTLTDVVKFWLVVFSVPAFVVLLGLVVGLL